MFNKLLATISQIFKTKDIRDKIIFTLLIILFFRVLASIPVVGIQADAIKQLFSQTGGNFGQLVSLVSGGVLETASIVAIGLAPYINASVVLQLLGSVIPKLEEMRKEGVEGRKKLSMITRFLTVPFAIMQSFVIYSTLRGFSQITLVENLGSLELIALIATLTGGSMVMMWFGELISEKGLGGGSSMLIFIGILAGIPSSIQNNFLTMDVIEKIAFIFVMIFTVTSVVYISDAEKRIKVQYSRRVRTGATYESYVPIKLTQFGVMPVIFATSLLTFPQLIANFLLSRDLGEKVTLIAEKVDLILSNLWVQNVGLFLLIVGFCFFYVTIVFNADDLAENFQKQGAFIPGIRPGKPTAQYLRKASFKLTAVGAPFLALLSVLPGLLSISGIEQSTVISGTGFLIAVGVVLEVKRQIESMIVVRSYDKYI
ncbi:MAG TPA: preprotein translocase subunit SecY [Candidatus Dojkabacteria bacterium]|mgnify:CR=1 FL=1|nr:preprotein translocase subunit SecY [Candidatus Dojkabacteria bacterium]HQG57848.1 preprotein translocase subunit SecY [Candidatus Dojkabacteria bacterium]